MSFSGLGGLLDSSISATTNEATCINGWVNGWYQYFLGGTENGFTWNPLSADTLAIFAVMRAAMAGMSVSGQAAAKVQAGIQAWWNYMVANPVTTAGVAGNSRWFTGDTTRIYTTITAPVGLSSIAANFAGVFAANQSVASKAAAFANVGTMLDTANVGGVATNNAGSFTIA